MLQVVKEAIYEPSVTMTTTNSGSGTMTGGGTYGYGETTGCYPSVQYWPYQTYWGSYPVYVCTDKTKKAIEVLKALQSEKLLKCDSVPRFIALVEKISNLL